MLANRLPRFRRSPSAVSIELTERDHEILRLVYRNRFLRSSHLIALLGGSSQQILRRLALLYHHGYLERPRAQLEYFHKGGSGSLVYGLGNKSASILKELKGHTHHENRWNEKNGSVGRIFLEHALLVSDFMVALEFSCRKSGDARLLTAPELLPSSDVASKPESFRWRVNISGGLKLGVLPDHVFALEYKNQKGILDRAYFFLEADRGTMPVIRKNLQQTSFYRKLLAYEATWSQSIHKTKFGFHRFRVVTVTKSAARAQSLVDACSKLKTGHGLFLFADKSIFEKPHEMLSAVWKTAKEGGSARLLD